VPKWNILLVVLKLENFKKVRILSAIHTIKTYVRTRFTIRAGPHTLTRSLARSINQSLYDFLQNNMGAGRVSSELLVNTPTAGRYGIVRVRTITWAERAGADLA
jgi:hypothetical protein